MAFDPEAYLADKPQPDAAPPSGGPPSTFDPEAYLAGRPQPSALASAAPGPTDSVAPPQQPFTEIPSASERAAIENQRGPDADQKVPTPPSEEETPGFWHTITSAFSRKMAEQAASDVAGTKILLPKGMGGNTFQEQFQEGQMHPKTKDKIDELLEEPLHDGWTDPKWWAAQLAGNLGGVAPGLGAALPIGLAAGPIAGIAAFGLEAALSRLVPAYNAARAAGLNNDDAITRSLIDTGITASFAAAMGLVGKFPITGAQKMLIDGELATVLKRPMLEAMVQIGAVQPSLMAGQDIATDLSHGEAPNAEQVLTDMLIGGVAGFGIHETFKSPERIQALMNARAEMAAGRPAKPSIPATPETIAAAAEAQRPKGPTDYRPEKKPAKAGAEPAAPVGPPPGPADDVPTDGAQYDRDIVARPGTSEFYSAVKNYVINDMPERMNGASFMNDLAKQPYVTRAEIAYLKLGDFLKDHNGQIRKDDILAHIESKEVQLIEVPYENQKDILKRGAEVQAKYALLYGSDESEWPYAAREHLNSIRAAFDTTKEPQWATWNPPGTQHIREFVLAVPAPKLDPAAVEAKAIDLWNDRGMRRFGPWEQISEEGRQQYRKAAEEWLHHDDPRTFMGGHYPIPNGFAHFRTGDFVDRNGRKILMLIEQQSDIHQEAQKTGKLYQKRDLPDPKVLEAETAVAFNKYNELLKQKQAELIARGKDRDYALLDPEVKKAGDEWRVKGKAESALWRELQGRLPNLPFKTEWQELVVKRALQLAADEGYDGVSWLNGDQVGLRLSSKEELKGARQSYGPTLNNLFKKWAKYVGSYTEPNQMIAFQRDWEKHVATHSPIRRAQLQALNLDYAAMGHNMWMPIGMEHSSVIQRGMPMWDKDVTAPHPRKGTRTLSENLQDNPKWQFLVRPAQKIDKAIQRLANEFKIRRGITIIHTDLDQPWRGRLKEGWDPATGHYVIEVNLRRILTEHDLYAAMSHEFGHVLYKELYETATDAERAAIDKAYNDFRAKIPSEELTVGDVRRIRDNAISEMTGARDAGKDLHISDLDTRTKEYLLGKFEWFSEQVAKWMQTDEKPLSIVDKFFKKLANKIRKMIGFFTKTELGPNAKPDQAVADFLNNHYGIPADFMEAPDEQFDMDTKKKAQAAMDREGAPETKVVPQQASSNGGREIFNALGMGKEGEGMAAHGDRMNWFYKYFTSLPQIAQLNPHLTELINYDNMHRMAGLMKNQIMGNAQDRIRQWAALRDPKQLEALTNFMSDYAEGKFKLPHTEDGIFRRPNAEEFSALVKKHGLSDQAVRLFQSVTTDFDGFLERYRKLLIDDAMRIKDPTRRQNNMDNINATMDKLFSRPFLPLTRFGKYSITVYGHDNKIRHYEQTNSLRRQKQIMEALEKHPDRLPGDRVLAGMVPKDTIPFLGMPPGLIDLISNKLSLSDSQRSALDQLRFDYAPAQTFKHQFRNLDLTPGWSTDYRRAYGDFFFHGANHITRIQFEPQMRAAIAALGSEQNRLMRAGQPGGTNKLDKIVKYAQTHMDLWLDPKSDWAGLRGLMFHWYLGFNPASAVVNLTQTPLMTHPYLASWFGDLQSAQAIAKASTDLNNFYKKTTITAAAEAAKGTPGREAARARAFGMAVSQGLLSETQAHELAALAEDRNMLRIFGKKAEGFWLKFQEASSWMFETSEQWNRRVAFAAAWNLAYDRPNHGLIKEAQKLYPLIFKDLTDPRGKNIPAHEAGAFLAALRATEQTQFNYAPYARPPIMRGKIGGTALVFKLFAQNSLFNLASNPSMAWRWALIMGMLGGLQGLVGFENVNSLLKTLAYRAFGKDFDLEDEARHFAHDVLGDIIGPDALMHGLSARGFGIPQVMHSMGVPFPTVDLSKSVGMGDPLGFDPFSPLGPVKDPKSEFWKQVGRASGAAFSLGPSLYDFAASNDNFSDIKKYETIMPRWAGSLSHAYRYFTQGQEVNRAGNAVVKFDPSDTMQMMEILSRALGFQPRRLTEEWSREHAVTEAANYWDLRRAGLMRQFGDAVKKQDAEGKERIAEAIKKFNAELPDEAKGKAITSAALRASVQQRLKVQARQEAGLPPATSNIPIAKNIEQYYPRGFGPDQTGAKVVQ